MDDAVRFSIRHRGVAPVGRVLLPVHTREEAVRLAGVSSALHMMRIPYATARLVAGDSYDPWILDADGLPTGAGMDAVAGDGSAVQVSRWIAAAERALGEAAPSAVLLGGDGDPALAIALAAARASVPLARVGMQPAADRSQRRDVSRRICGRLADVVFADSEETLEALAHEGVARDRLHVAGDTVGELARVRTPDAMLRGRRPAGLLPGGYLCAQLGAPGDIEDDRRTASLVHALAGLAARIPTVAILSEPLRACLHRTGELMTLVRAGARILAPPPYLDTLAIAAGSGAVVTDSEDVCQEAQALGVAAYLIARSMTHGADPHSTVIVLGDDPAELAEIRLMPRRALPAAPPPAGAGPSQRVTTELVRRLGLPAAGPAGSRRVDLPNAHASI